MSLFLRLARPAALALACVAILPTSASAQRRRRPEPAPAPEPAPVVAPAPVAAPTPTPEPSSDDEAARVHFMAGRLSYDRGDYEAALREFEAAFELSHRPALQFNLYLCHERLGHFAEAATALEAFLASGGPVEDRPTLEARLTALQERARAASAPPPPVVVDHGPSGLTIGGFVALGVGAASLVAFGVTGGLALAEDGRLASSCGRDATRTCTDADVSTLGTLDTVADVTLVVGIVAAGAGAALLAVDATQSHEPSTTASLSITPYAVPRPGSADVGLRLAGSF